MKEVKRRQLEAKGWSVGTVAEFLNLTPEEVRFIEFKLALTDDLRYRRAAMCITQVALAKRLGSSQSRVAKMEAGDPTVSIDLLLRSLFALGASSSEIAKSVSRPRRTRRLAV